MNYKIITAKDNPGLLEKNDQLAQLVWSEFMLHDPVANKYFGELYSLFADYQFALIDESNEKIAAMGNCIPFCWDDEISNLPDDGWDWVMEKGVDDYKAGLKPNIFSAIQIMISPEYKNQKLSYQAVKTMKEIGKEKGFKNMVAPVRPNLKKDYPLMPMEKYIKWKNEKGESFDPWLRVHTNLGGEIIKVCPTAMHIYGTISEWEKWTDMKFPVSGQYTIPGALNPVDFSVEDDKGIYIEPNVWVCHNLE